MFIAFLLIGVLWFFMMKAVYETVRFALECRLLRRRDFLKDHIIHLNIEVSEEDDKILDYVRDEVEDCTFVLYLDLWLAEKSLPNIGFGSDFLRAEKNILMLARSASV